jgi:hypothetical protein
MSSMLCIPSNLEKVRDILKLYPKKYYDLPQNFADLPLNERMKELCKRKDSYSEKILPNNYLGKYIDELLYKYKKAVHYQHKDYNKLLSLKIVFLYDYLNNKITKQQSIEYDLNCNINPDAYNVLNIDIPDDEFIDIDLENSGLRKKYYILQENYANYCIIKDYIDKYYLSNTKNSLNFDNYKDLDYFGMINFLRIVEYDLVDYNKICENIINYCGNKKKKELFMDSYDIRNIQLEDLLGELQSYNDNPYSYFNKCKKQEEEMLMVLQNNYDNDTESEFDEETDNDDQVNNDNVDDLIID